MSPDVDARLRAFASDALFSLFAADKVCPPISSQELLTRLIAATPLTPGARPPFRLTDLAPFERTLRALARDWDHGALYIQDLQAGASGAPARGGLIVVDVQLGRAARPASGIVRKRKRVAADSDADSAAGSPPPEGADVLADADDGAPPGEAHTNGPKLGDLPIELKEIYALLQRPTAKSRLLAEQFRSDAPFDAICAYTTKEKCIQARSHAASLSSPPTEDAVRSPHLASTASACGLVHFREIRRPHTDPALGHCSYLNTCYSEPTYALSPSILPPASAAHSRTGPGMGMGPGGAPNANSPVSLPSGLGAGGRGKEKAPCRYLHFEVDYDENSPGAGALPGRAEHKEHPKKARLQIGLGPTGKLSEPLPPQWINCDVRRFHYSVLGKFEVIMADPPWDIHMSLPYGTMTDDEMRAMPIPMLQDEGLIFLWVTGRAMEVGRECLRVWGYTRVDEVVWVKTNQLQRVIRTGRTGHWLNHTKEHMLVGLKTHTDAAGNLVWPAWVNRGLDTDVVVSEVRETSRKPDEVYGLIERMCPGGRKIEIFGRRHNTRPGWLTLGNQLGQDQIHEPDLAERLRERYPERAPGALAGSTPGAPPVMPPQSMSQNGPRPPMGPPMAAPPRHGLPMNPTRAMVMMTGLPNGQRF